MRVLFGDIKTELPDGWLDGSIIKFADPSRAASEGQAQPSLVIVRAHHAGESLPSIIEAHAEQLADTLVGFMVTATGTLAGRHGDVHYQEHLFGELGEFSQILLLTMVSNTVYIITGTSSTEDYQTVRSLFTRAATELEVLN